MEFLSKLVDAYNIMYDNLDVPDNFNTAIIFPIHKKGDTDLPENYRGLSFLNTITKIFTGILSNRLLAWEREHKILSESQAGFRPGYSTTDNLFSLLNIIKLAHELNIKKVYAFFVDLKAAFDTIDRQALFYKLFNMGISSKMVKMIQCLYKNTKAHIWNGVALSEDFETLSGVRQGCVLSPLLFAFFMNDMEDFLEVGLRIEEVEIKALLYADDIIILADDPLKLQRMILQLENYCKTWNLSVNLDKSKIMIFQRGGGTRLSSESWSYDHKRIEVVKNYPYLGVVLTPKLSLSVHFKQRLKSAKASLNCTWVNFVMKKEVGVKDKVKLFNAASKSVLCHGSQVWGFQLYDDVEKFQRFFIKKLLNLPQHAPNYALYIETGLSYIYIHTLKSHFSYLHKVLFVYSSERLPQILAKKVIERGIFWYEVWRELWDKHGVELSLTENQYLFQRGFREIIKKEDAWLKEKCTDRARLTVRHGLYDKLSYDENEINYFRNSLPANKISMIFKYRTGLIDLNASPWRKSGSSLCSMCNLMEEETLSHFLGRCPILTEFRVYAFNKIRLEDDNIMDILNGKDNYDNLFLYVLKAWKYRKFLIDEFNS